MQGQPQLHQLIAQYFSFEELVQLCYEVGTDIENLPGSSKTTRALELVSQMQRYGRLGQLLLAIVRMRPELDVTSYLHLLIAEHFTAADIEELCAKLSLDCYSYGLDSKSLAAYDFDRYRKQEIAKTLQDAVRNAGETGELLRMLSLKAPGLGDVAIKGQVTSKVAITSQLEISRRGGEGLSEPSAAEQAALQAPDRYERFDIRVGRSRPDDGRYPVEVLSSPSGVTVEPVWQSLALDKVTLTPQKLETLATDPDVVKALGRELRDFLFPEPVWRHFYLSLASMGRQGKGLRIRLQLEAPELTAVPWEYCYDEKFGEFLGLSKRSPFVRAGTYAMSARPVSVPEQVRVLIATASPEGLPPFDERQELASVMEAGRWLEPRMAWKLVRQATRRGLLAQLRSYEPHIVHFVGHGLAEGPEVSLALTAEGGGVDVLNVGQLASLLRDSRVEVVILAAPHGAVPGTEKAILGASQALVQGGVPAVIAMPYRAPDPIAARIVQQGYRHLITGMPLEMAVTEMRRAVFELGDEVYWGVPVYFANTPDGIIWQPDAQALEFFLNSAGMGAPQEISVESVVGLLKQMRGVLDRHADAIAPGDVEDIADALVEVEKLVMMTQPRRSRIERRLAFALDIAQGTEHSPLVDDMAALVQQTATMVDQLFPNA